jgi:hypothetical protein
MTPGGLLVVLETVADECADLDIPEDPHMRDALYTAAMRVSGQSLELAKRVAEAQHVGRWRRRGR